MSTRYGDRERDLDRRSQKYGRRPNLERGRADEDRWSGRSRYDSAEGERYSLEDRWRGDYGDRYPSRSGREFQSDRDDYRTSELQGERDYSSERGRRYSNYGRGYDSDRQYGDASNISSQRFNYPTGFRSGETYGGHGAYEGDYRTRYDQREGRDYEYDASNMEGERGWWDRASDEVASWFGDEEATRRRRVDHRRDEYRGRGPKGYKRSDERIKEDINDRLSEGYLDATEIEVAVQNTEVTLTGTVNSRADKRRAEAIAESVTGVTNVENRLRATQGDYGRYGSMETSGTTGSTSATGTTGTPTSATGTISKRASTGS